MNTLRDFISSRGPVDGAALVQGEDYLVMALLGLLFLILTAGVFFFWLTARHARERQVWTTTASLHPSRRRRSEGDAFRSEIFESPCRWIAVRTTDPHAVQVALNLTNPTLCTWADGLDEVCNRRLFITPPIGQWVLVVGSGLPDPSDDVDKCYHLLIDLSRKLGLVQFFSLNRALGHHAWARLDSGEVLRAYAWIGHVVWNQGPPSPAELGLNLRCYEYLEAVENTWSESHDPILQNLDRLPMLAARWSVDPTALDERYFATGRGIAGEIT